MVSAPSGCDADAELSFAGLNGPPFSVSVDSGSGSGGQNVSTVSSPAFRTTMRVGSAGSIQYHDPYRSRAAEVRSDGRRVGSAARRGNRSMRDRSRTDRSSRSYTTSADGTPVAPLTAVSTPNCSRQSERPSTSLKPVSFTSRMAPQGFRTRIGAVESRRGRSVSILRARPGRGRRTVLRPRRLRRQGRSANTGPPWAGPARFARRDH